MTTRKYDDYAQRVSRAQAIELLGLVHDAVIVRDLARGAVRYWNRGAEELYGWSAAEALDRDPLRLLRTVSTPTPVLITAEVLRRGSWEGSLRQTARDGTRRMVISRWTLREDEGGANILQTDHDVTGEFRESAARATIKAARDEEVRRLGELAALKADFSAIVAHELGGPVAAIARLAEALAICQGDPLMQTKLLVALQSEVALLNALTADVRQVATAERDDFAVHPRPVPLASVLAEAVGHAETLPGGHPVRLVDETPGGARVLADPQRIGQVLRNLLSNAAKYSPDGSPIELRAEPEGDARRVRLAVVDRGYGIEPDDMRRILEKFGRGRDRSGHRVPGLGLGLYLSRRIVQAHGGDFAIASVPGRGTTIDFVLECAP
jgi:PAS domain S-box-containing protein